MNGELFTAVIGSLPDVISNTLTLNGGIWLAITLVCYGIALRIHHSLNAQPLLHPLVITALLVSAVTVLFELPIKDYRQYASLLHWLLGPATVALALPMYNQWHHIRQLGWRLIVSIGVGGVIAPLLAWFIIWWADAPLAVQMTMLLKSITTPLAMEASELIGGIPELAAVFVIVTGIVGAVASVFVFRLTKINNELAQGVALGTVAHAIGTARALQFSEQAGAMATMGLCVNGIMTAVIVPVLFA